MKITDAQATKMIKDYKAFAFRMIDGTMYHAKNFDEFKVLINAN